MRARFKTIFAFIVFSAYGFAQTPVIDQTRIQNSATGASAGGIVPGSLITIYGTNLATTLTTSDSVPLSKQLNGVTVKFGDQQAPLYFVAPGQINAQVPWEVVPVGAPGTTGTVQIVVSRNGAASTPVTYPAATVDPGIFAITLDSGGNVVGTGTGQAIAYGNSDYQFAAPAGAIKGYTTHPAKIGDPLTLAILATGLGPVDATVVTGSGVTTAVNTITKPDVLVGGVAAQVVFSGVYPVSPGVYQLNIIIQPGTPTGNAIPLQIRMNGKLTTDKVTIAVSN
jgi:uncharacterized protein (TIGR03437 family)